MASTLIESAKILVQDELTTAHIFIEDGLIRSITKLRPANRPDVKIDAAGLIALPGMIDTHVHLRDLELAYKETFETGTQAAAAGGFTTILDMPNTKPPTVNSERLREKITRAQGRLYVNVGFQGALLRDLAQMKEMSEAGAIAFKLYMNKALEPFDSSNDAELQLALNAAKDCNALVTIHAEEGAAIRAVQERSVAEGRTKISDFLRAHNTKVEVSAVRRLLNLTGPLRLRAHICHITVPEAVRIAKKTPNTTCEATAHHLLVNQGIFKKQKTLAICVPPVRDERCRRGLWGLFARGQVDILASDHAPHTLEEKTQTDVWKSASGVPGLETSLPVMLTQVHRRKITLARLVEATATLPTRIFQLRNKGALREGFDADVVLVDPKAKVKIRPEDFLSKAKYSPFAGMPCTGQPAYTIVHGTVVAERGRIMGPPVGQVVRGVS